MDYDWWFHFTSLTMHKLLSTQTAFDRRFFWIFSKWAKWDCMLVYGRAVENMELREQTFPFATSFFSALISPHFHPSQAFYLYTERWINIYFFSLKITKWATDAALVASTTSVDDVSGSIRLNLTVIYSVCASVHSIRFSFHTHKWRIKSTIFFFRLNANIVCWPLYKVCFVDKICSICWVRKCGVIIYLLFGIYQILAQLNPLRCWSDMLKTKFELINFLFLFHLRGFGWSGARKSELNLNWKSTTTTTAKKKITTFLSLAKNT